MGPSNLRFPSVAALAAASLWSAAAAAQPGPSPPNLPNLVRVPCCRCVDGTTQRVNISSGTAPWRVTAPGGLAAVVANPPAAWTTALAPARWIGRAGQAPGSYTYDLNVWVPQCLIPATVRLSARLAGDNSERVMVDNVQRAQHAGILGFQTANIIGFNSPPPALGAGMHSIRVIVENRSGPTAMVLNGAITVTCPTNPEP